MTQQPEDVTIDFALTLYNAQGKLTAVISVDELARLILLNRMLITTLPADLPQPALATAIQLQQLLASITAITTPADTA